MTHFGYFFAASYGVEFMRHAGVSTESESERAPVTKIVPAIINPETKPRKYRPFFPRNITIRPDAPEVLTEPCAPGSRDAVFRHLHRCKRAMAPPCYLYGQVTI